MDEQQLTHCKSCGTNTTHILQKHLISWPRVLMLHIKRHSRKGWAEVDIPSTLRPHKCCPEIYKFRSALVRYGNTADFGHYTCHAVGENGTWIQFNDSSVHSYGERPDPRLGRNAHVLFFVLESDTNEDSNTGLHNLKPPSTQAD